MTKKPSKSPNYKKQQILLFFLLLLATRISATPVDQEAAKQSTKTFMAQVKQAGKEFPACLLLRDYCERRFVAAGFSYTMPCAIMALATFMNPAMLAPFT